MSRVTGNGVRIGESNTQTNNFSFETDINGKLTLHKGNVGNNLGTILESDATGTIVKTTDVQFGNSTTATNNFHLTTDGAGGCTLYRGNAGTVSTPVLSVDSTGLVSRSASNTLYAIAAASTVNGSTVLGTYVDGGVSLSLGVGRWLISWNGLINGASSGGTGGAAATIVLTDAANTIIDKVHGDTILPSEALFLSNITKQTLVNVITPTTYKLRFCFNIWSGTTTISSCNMSNLDAPATMIATLC